MQGPVGSQLCESTIDWLFRFNAFRTPQITRISPLHEATIGEPGVTESSQLDTLAPINVACWHSQFLIQARSNESELTNSEKLVTICSSDILSGMLGLYVKAGRHGQEKANIDCGRYINGTNVHRKDENFVLQVLRFWSGDRIN